MDDTEARASRERAKATLPTTVRAFMRWSGYTAQDVAKALDVGTSAVSDRFAGNTDFKAHEIYVLAKMFDVHTDDLFRTPEEIMDGRGTGNQLMEAQLARMAARLLLVEQRLVTEHQAEPEPGTGAPRLVPDALRSPRAAPTSQASEAGSGGRSSQPKRVKSASTAPRKPSSKARRAK